jgi:hypothetical protein
VRPKEVWLAGIKWKIRFVQVLPDSDSGITTDSDRLIQVAVAGAVEGFIRQTLMHEILHACVFTVGGAWPPSEESAVRLLERPLTSLFADERNIPLRRWLEEEA